MAVSVEQGLLVPVVHHADRLSTIDIAARIADLGQRARDGKLQPQEMQGGTFTITNLGMFGVDAFTPIINSPEVAILGVSRHTMQPVWDGEKFEPRLMLPLSLSYDHRVIDGAMAVRFTTFLGETLGDVDGLLQAIP